MIRIALCDDDKAFLSRLEVKVTQYFRQQSIAVEITVFTQGEVLLNRLSVGNDYDLLFLDVGMPGMNGLDIAREVRKQNRQLLIIFLTSFLGFAQDAFEVDAFRYIAKFRMEDKLASALKDAVCRLERYRKKCLVVSCYNDIQRIPYEDILYVQRVNRMLEIVTKSCGCVNCRKGIKELHQEADDSRFIFVDRGCFVNIEHVLELVRNRLHLSDGTYLSVSRMHLQNLKLEINRVWGRENE